MTLAAIAGLGSSVISAFTGNSAADAQKQAADKAQQIQQQQFQSNQDLIRPQIEAGDTARSFELGALGLPGGVDKARANNAFTTSPGYDFRLNQGVQARDQGAANAGTLNSGAQAKALTQFGQDYGSNEYGNYFSRLQALANGGAGATGQATQLGQNFADNSSNIALGQGRQQASAYTGIGSNIAGTAGGLADLYASTYRQPTATSNYNPAQGGGIFPQPQSYYRP